MNTQKYQERINKWSMPVPFSGCWIWIGSTGNSGYGKTRFNHSDDLLAHRVSYLGFKGEIPQGMCVLHSCDTRTCVNPQHLFLGTHSDNSKDMVAKGRHKCPAKLRTKCPKGHDYSGFNSNGARICAVCNKETRQRYEQRKNHAINAI